MPNDHDPSVPSLPSDKRNAIDSFLREIRTSGTVVPGTRGRLLFALDATASRQPTWDSACQLQATCFGRRRRSAGAGRAATATRPDAAPQSSGPSQLSHSARGGTVLA